MLLIKKLQQLDVNIPGFPLTTAPAIASDPKNIV